VRSTIAEPDKRPVTLEELLVSSLAQTDALAKLLIEKGLITREEFMQKISEERATSKKDILQQIHLTTGGFYYFSSFKALC
jgi:hypothetical protein